MSGEADEKLFVFDIKVGHLQGLVLAGAKKTEARFNFE
jgi:hypothetical protein